MNRNAHQARLVWLAIAVVVPLATTALVPAFNQPVTAASAQAAAPNSSAAAIKFDQDIQPIFENHCYDCHSSATRAAGGLLLDDRDAILKGGRSGPAIVLGKPDESLLIQRLLSTEKKTRMPKGEEQPLADKEIAALRAWIEQGAPWGAPKSASAPATTAAPHGRLETVA